MEKKSRKFYLKAKSKNGIHKKSSKITVHLWLMWMEARVREPEIQHYHALPVAGGDTLSDKNL